MTTNIDMTYRYTLLYRPPSFCTAPKGWNLIERPAPGLGFDKRTDLPLSEHTFGVIEYDRPLTAEEIATFELKRVA